MKHLFYAMAWFLALVCVLLLVNYYEYASRENKHDNLTKGCAMVGTIQAVDIGRSRMPAMEQWNCNGMMRTVEAVNQH